LPHCMARWIRLRASTMRAYEPLSSFAKPHGLRGDRECLTCRESAGASPRHAARDRCRPRANPRLTESGECGKENLWGSYGEGEW
jgi:hypothetical protein